MEPSEPYHLLVATGKSPPVITETVWALARQRTPPRHPEVVTVLTTAVGEAYVRARLLGEKVEDPRTGQLVTHAEARWEPFCQEVVGRAVPLRFVVPPGQQAGAPLSDIRSLTGDRRFADTCYRAVEERTRAGAARVVGSIAGGRKTMSAHLTTAFAVYARAADRLLHVLVHPPSLEGDPAFFHPEEHNAPEEARVHCVEVEFPRLRPLLEEPLRLRRPEGPLAFRELLAELAPYTRAEKEPRALQVRLEAGGAHVRALGGRTGGNTDDGHELAVLHLPPGVAATLLVVAEHIGGPQGTVAPKALFAGAAERRAAARRHRAHRQRRAVLHACQRLSDRPSVWMNTTDVSQAISRLNQEMSASPPLARWLSVEGEREGRRIGAYRWAEPLPAPLTLRAEEPPSTWPFDHLAAPERG
jgi:CRISPR-associated protein (TIGR02584 family)